MRENELYLAVLPLIHLTTVGPMGFGLTEEVLTLLPGREMATRFHRAEVEKYISTFQNRTQYITGGRVRGYELRLQQDEGSDLVIVQVIQLVG
jgi:hypothetical protein